MAFVRQKRGMNLLTKKAIAIVICLLIIILPVSAAEDTNKDDKAFKDFDEQQTGETVIVNVKSYEPTVLRSNILEDDDVDVYAFLTGYTLGSALSRVAKISQEKNEPFYAQPEIKHVKVRPLDSKTEEFIKNTKYVRPLTYTLDDLGTVVLRLKKIPAEKDMPKEINLNMAAEITFDNAERLFNLMQQDLVIPEDLDEETWKDKNPEEYRFFSGRGFIRAIDITSASASFKVYETQGYKEQSSGIFSSIAIVIKNFIQTRSVTLNVGETSDFMRFSALSFVPENAFRIKLNSIKDPQLAKARVRVSIDGKTQNLVLYEGLPLFSGSSYRVSSIDQKTLQDGQKREEITIKGNGGDAKATKTYKPSEQQALLTEVYKGDNEVIQQVGLPKLEDVMKKYFPSTKIHPPNILLSSDITREFEIKKEMTQADVLAAILPSQYTFTEKKGVIEIKTAKETSAAKDVCDGRVAVIATEKDITEGAMENVICTAISEYKDLAKNYGSQVSKKGIAYRDEANYKIGKLYLSLYSILQPEEQLSAAESAVNYFERAAANPEIRANTEVLEELDSLKKDIEKDAQYGPAVVEDNGREVVVTLKEIIPIPTSQRPQTTIQIGGKGRETFMVGDTIPTDESKDYAWRIKSIETDKVIVEKVQLGTVKIMAEQKELRVKSPQKVDNVIFNVQEIQLHKQAHISIIPGTGKPLTSNTNFTIHIPIEKRLIQLSPENINNQLNQTQHWIDEIDKTTARLESVVKTWNTVCLATFAFLTIKNSFFLGFARSEARKSTIYGADGKSGWAQYCTDNSGAGRSYSSYDECFRKNEGKIEKQIDESQNARKQADKEVEDYKNQQWYKEITSDYKQLDKYGKYTGEEAFFTKDELWSYRYQQLMKQTSSYSTLTGQEGGYNLKDDLDKNTAGFENTNEKAKAAYNSAVGSITQNYKGLKPEEEQQAFNDLLKQKMQAQQAGAISSEEFRELNEKTVTVIPLLRKNQDGTAYINTENGKTNLQQATVNDYVNTLSAPTAQDQQNTENEITRIKSKYKNNMNAPLSTTQGNVYVNKATGKLYASAAAYDLTQLNTEYKVKKVEVYPDGKPYCVPTTNGDYVKVLDFFEDGSPRTVQLWNVGTDGMVCSNDDIPLKHETLLNLPENEAEQRSLRSKAARIGKHQEGEVIGIGKDEFTVSTSLSRTSKTNGEPSCYDVMDPDDCSTLFGVCDPVMCPASRFNLGGTYQVENVVQSGIVGSLVLGLNNFNAKEPVPICLTGVLAGLKNIKSILEGYTQCLKEAQATGKSVGICDQIRSIFICDVIYREALSLFKARGGILNWMAKKTLGQGGNEYLNFQNSLQNVQSSVSFFTQEYAKTAFAAFRGRTTEEVGKTVCSAAIYGKLPKLGQVVDQLTEPESPPQFMAKLSVSPHTESARISKEAYNIFYHIYAGENKKAQYTVFLRNREGDSYYATDKCNGRGGEMPAGGIASQSLDCIADSGFDEICVTINGVTECGFGKVTSSFSLNYMNELVVEDEVSKKISSEEDCVPDTARYSSPLQSLVPAAGPLASSGTVRVCSVQNPGQGTNPESWKIVGTCGKDNAGRSIGSCWMDLRTVTIKDTERLQRVQNALAEAGLNATKTAEGITHLLDKEASEAELKRLDAMPKQTVTQMIGLAQAYKALGENSLSLAAAAEANSKVAGLYESLSLEAVMPLHSIPGSALTTAKTAASKIKGKVPEKLSKELESACMECDSWAGWCTLGECHKISSSCAFTKKPIAGGFFAEIDALKDDECGTCSTAKDCSYFNADQARCKDTKCTAQAGLECKWAKIFGTFECVPLSDDVSTDEVITSGRIIPIPKHEKIKCVANNCKINSNLIPYIEAAADQLDDSETLLIYDSYRTPEEQRSMFIEYLMGKRNAEVSGPAVPKEPASVNLQVVQDIDSYKNRPHVSGLAVDIYLCDSNRKIGGPKAVCTQYLNTGENSERLQEVMCNADWIGYAGERWHYEYNSEPWKKARTDENNPDKCLYGDKDKINNRENIQVTSPLK